MTTPHLPPSPADPDTAREIDEKRHEEGSIGELLSRLVDDAEDFVRAEIKLYRVEAIHKVNLYRSLLVIAAIGGLLAFGSVTLMLIALVFALSPFIGAAWAAFLVALVAMLLAALLIGSVTARIRRDLGDREDEDA
ncbi:phage holin family protein [Sphingomonas colocasiae]|uniref:Phage holin family protein n=1 Tax=Sphingomonas colocasiae TaxID=1848973 RepID=A0ABS7PHF7_9SPHN|nr:phage holin family protein [Sphingomonas colocasiae]MBY8820683.1 phage holin family protein [Sphingomonas colocasiae]